MVRISTSSGPGGEKVLDTSYIIATELRSKGAKIGQGKPII